MKIYKKGKWQHICRFPFFTYLNIIFHNPSIFPNCSCRLCFQCFTEIRFITGLVLTICKEFAPFLIIFIHRLSAKYSEQGFHITRVYPSKIRSRHFSNTCSFISSLIVNIPFFYLNDWFSFILDINIYKNKI